MMGAPYGGYPMMGAAGGGMTASQADSMLTMMSSIQHTLTQMQSFVAQHPNKFNKALQVCYIL